MRQIKITLDRKVELLVDVDYSIHRGHVDIDDWWPAEEPANTLVSMSAELAEKLQALILQKVTELAGDEKICRHMEGRQ